MYIQRHMSPIPFMIILIVNGKDISAAARTYVFDLLAGFINLSRTIRTCYAFPAFDFVVPLRSPDIEL